MRPVVAQLDQSGAADGDVVTWDDSAGMWVAAAPAGGGGGSLTVQDENSNVSTSVTQVDFQGAGVAATSGTGEVVVTVPGYTDEQAQDAAASLIAAGTHSGISFSYNDAGNALSATVPGGTAPPASADVLSDFTAALGSPLGSATDYEFDAVTASLPSGWSWVNQGTSTYAEQMGAGIMAPQPSGGVGTESLRCIAQTMPSESVWTASAKIQFAAGRNNWTRAGLILRESSSGKLVTFGIARGATSDPQATASVEKWNSPTSFNSSFSASPELGYFYPYLRIKRNSATSWDFSFSMDGRGWAAQALAQNVGGFMTPDQIGFFTSASNTTVLGGSIEWFRVR